MMGDKVTSVSDRLEVNRRISGKKHKKRKKDKRRRAFSGVALAVFAVSFCFLCAAFIYVDILGILAEELFGKILIGVVSFLFLGLSLQLIARKSIILSIFSILLCLVVVAGSAFGIYSLYKIYESMQMVEEPKTYYAQIGIYVIKDSRFVPAYTENEEGEQIEIPGDGFDSCNVGTLLLNVDRGYSSQGMRLFRKDYDVTVITFDDVGDMIDSLKSGEIDAIVFNQA